MNGVSRIFLEQIPNLENPSGVGIESEALHLTLSDRDSHHLRNVLRVSPGNLLTVVERCSGREFEALVAETQPEVIVKIVREFSNKASCGRVASLAFAMMKGSKNDWVIEKSCELGVKTIIVWQAARSVVHIKNEAALISKRERWQRIAEAAARQSGKNYIPEIVVLSGIQLLIAEIARRTGTRDRRLCCSLSPQAKEVRFLAAPQGFVHLVVGPEGDFSPAEESELHQSSFDLVSLGPFVLRGETAAISAVAMVQGIWGAVT